jgi:hypothetical protein
VKPRTIGKGLLDKRARIVRCLDAHLRYLTMLASLGPFTPPEHTERPPRPPDPDPYRVRPSSHFWTPREKPALKYPAPGPEALSEEEVKAWVAEDAFIRGGLSMKTARALAFVATFEPARKRAPRLLSEPWPVQRAHQGTQSEPIARSVPRRESEPSSESAPGAAERARFTERTKVAERATADGEHHGA